MSRISPVLALWFMVAGVVGCSSSSGTATGAPPLADTSCAGGCWHPSDADKQFVQNFCSLTADCCVGVSAGNQANVSRADHVSRCQSVLLSNGFSSDAATQAACLAELSQAANTPSCMPEILPPNPNAACSRLMAEPTGSVAPGGSCAVPGDCAGSPGALSDCAPGRVATCYQMTRGKQGESCTATVSDSGSEYFGTDYTGRYCATTDGLVCYAASGSSNYVCTPLFADASPCVHGFECASHVCSQAPTPVCGPTPAIQDQPAGASCQNDSECASAHCVAGQCQSAAQYVSRLSLCSSTGTP